MFCFYFYCFVCFGEISPTAPDSILHEEQLLYSIWFKSEKKYKRYIHRFSCCILVPFIKQNIHTLLYYTLLVLLKEQLPIKMNIVSNDVSIPCLFHAKLKEVFGSELI